MHPIQNGTPNGDMQRVPAMQEPLNDICRGWRRRVVRREILHMSLSQREVPAAAGWPSDCVFLGPRRAWAARRLF